MNARLMAALDSIQNTALFACVREAFGLGIVWVKSGVTGVSVDKQQFFGELERRCNVFLESGKTINSSYLEERDNLIRFAKAAVKLQVITKPEVQKLIDRVDRYMFGEVEETP